MTPAIQPRSQAQQKLSPAFKFVLLGSLYTSQFLPSAFFFQALPIFLRQQGASLQVIGLLGLLTLPWMLKFLWAPLVDRYGSRRWGHYKSWIVVTQLLLAPILISCASMDAADNTLRLFQGVFVVVTLAATQDIATDALAVRLLAPHELGWGNGIQSAGRAMGGILGGGVMLLVLNQLGWQGSVWILVAGVLLALVPLFFYREPGRRADRDEETGSDGVAREIANYAETLLSFVRQSGALLWLFFILLYVTGSSMAATMFRPLLVDLGLSMADIGWMTGIVGSGAAIVGSLLAGGLIHPLGYKRSLIVFGILQAIAVIALILPAMGVRDPVVLYGVSTGEVFARSLANTALFTVMMVKSRRETAGSDYTLQSSVFIIGHHVGVPALSGFIATAMGYTSVFLIGLVICLVSAWLATQVVSRSDSKHGIEPS
ncbi:arabinose efflux permease [Rubidibacter lacunae KORDI 51-2]|uniref:Arabinose efflux permease n=1 Tax=Rubidibacter lacunae KORDI 51-2 TaxID=582515 RepID=U5DEU3_9CHRO|nr:MFS transporter [Rubidibacter lacunae]ERN43018.1 arabinose efflux permease [Rubidibacter lacunae KORDI 51-2]